MNSAQRAGAWNRLGLLIGLAASGCAPPLAELLVGSYAGATCETTGQASVYYLRQLLFSPLNYSSTIRFYSDSACTSFTLLYEQQGAYRLGQPSASVADATEVELDAAVRVLTAQTAAAAATLNTIIPCGGATAGGWTVGVRRDITAYGCKDLIPPSQGTAAAPACPTEYDVLALRGGALYLGQRPADPTAQCTAANRPSSLGAALMAQ